MKSMHYSLLLVAFNLIVIHTTKAMEKEPGLYDKNSRTLQSLLYDNLGLPNELHTYFAWESNNADLNITTEIPGAAQLIDFSNVEDPSLHPFFNKAQAKKQEAETKEEEEEDNEASKLEQYAIEDIEVINKKLFKCNDCRFTSKIEELYEKHIKIRHCEKPYICTMCKRGFDAQSKLTIHKRCHTESVFGCPLCHHVFKKQSDFKSHLKGPHNARLK